MSSARLNPSSQPGPLGTMSCADYAQLLKTLCLNWRLVTS
jgi:hypothetical protein